VFRFSRRTLPKHRRAPARHAYFARIATNHDTALIQSAHPQSADPAHRTTPDIAHGARSFHAATRFVLVEPSHPGNVGAAARALKTMGFADLTLVRPRVAEVLRDPDAVAMASGADDVLAQARIVDSLEQALTGMQWSVALSARLREYGPPLLAPRAAAQKAAALHAQGGTIAFVFGNERTGLANEDVERCRAIAHIPANPAYASLNLAQAVQVIAYELRLAYLDHATGVGGAAKPEVASASLATSDEIEGMFEHLERALIALEFFDPANPRKLQSRLRGLFARTDLEREEVNIVRGIAKHILLKIRS
jgi:tRNA/rRNA methyltransferase